MCQKVTYTLVIIDKCIVYFKNNFLNKLYHIKVTLIQKIINLIELYTIK